MNAAIGTEKVFMAPFAIVIAPARSRSDSGAGSFSFADIPELSFVESYPETEHLGPFHLDNSNRWTPGDLTNSSGWRPRLPTRLEVLDGFLDGVDYDQDTGILRYDGNGAVGWALVQLVSPNVGARSNPFYIRVLRPSVIWGANATTREDIKKKFPSVPKFDAGKTSYRDAWSAVPTVGEEDHPDVMLILTGSYDSATEARLSGQVDEQTGQPASRVRWLATKSSEQRPWFYLVGEPGARPRISGQDVRSGGILFYAGYRVTVFRNIELETMVTGSSGGWRVGVPNRKYWSKLFVHSTYGLNRSKWPDVTAINDDVFGSDSSEGDTTDKTVRFGVPLAPNDWQSFFWNNQFLKTGGNVLKHTIYLHGRPDAWLVYNNNVHNGGNQSSAVKATVGHYRVLNSRISAFADENNPGDLSDPLNQQLLDVPSASDVAIYNNHLIGGKRLVDGKAAGTRAGLISFRQRRTLWGSDIPRYPDVTFQDAPFKQFSFPFDDSDVAGDTYPNATVEIRKENGSWQPAAKGPAFVPNAKGSGDDWIVTLDPDEISQNGIYEVRIVGGDLASKAPVQLTVYRNSNYLAVTSFQDAHLQLPWYSDGPKAFVPDAGQEYWDAMRSWKNGSSPDGRAIPDNPFTFKKFVAFNRFTWLNHPDLVSDSHESIRDSGTLPATAIYIGSTASRYGAVPPNWLDASVTFLANNSYEGWHAEDVGTSAFRRTDAPSIAQMDQNRLYGPGQDKADKSFWPNHDAPLPADREPLMVEVGGERKPGSPNVQEVPLPAWFRF